MATETRRVVVEQEVIVCNRCNGHTPVMWKANQTFEAIEGRPGVDIGSIKESPYSGILCTPCARMMATRITTVTRRTKGEKAVADASN